MTGLRAAALAAALLFALLAGCGDDDDDERVSSAAPDFTVELPEGWEEQDEATREEAGESGIEALGDELGIPEEAQFSVDVQALWSVAEPDGDFRTNVNVIHEELEPVTPEEYLRFTERQLESTAILTESSGYGPGPDVGGEPSQELEYRTQQGGLDLRLRLVTIFRDEAAYNVTLTAAADEFEQASADLDQIFAGWSWN